MQKLSQRSTYLLVIWQERSTSPDHPAVWRYSLEDVRTGQKRGFGSLEELVIFFQRRMAVEDQRNRRSIE